MKIILPLLICSAISAALGYYFGRISAPTPTEGVEVIAPSPTTVTTAPAEPEVVEPEEPVIDPVPEPVEEPEMAVEETTEPDEEQLSFEKRSASTTQTLTDTQGRTIQVNILEVMDSEVKIRQSNGMVVTIPLNMLSEEDVAFCNYLREQQAEEEVKQPQSTEGFDWDAYFNS